jgi:hypothetical protein
MKMQLVCYLVGTLLLGGCSKSTVEKTSHSFNALPAPVQKTVRARVPNGEITDVTKQTRSGNVVYEIKFRDANLHPAIIVAQDGTLVRYDVGTAKGQPGDVSARAEGSASSGDMSALPVAVQKAIEENAPKADVAKVSRTEQNGNVLYEIQFVGKGANPTLVVAPDGKIAQPLQRTQSNLR